MESDIVAHLGLQAECKKLQLGLMWGKPGKLAALNAGQLKPLMTRIRERCVHQLSMWTLSAAGAATSAWWEALRFFLSQKEPAQCKALAKGGQSASLHPALAADRSLRPHAT